MKISKTILVVFTILLADYLRLGSNCNFDGVFLNMKQIQLYGKDGDGKFAMVDDEDFEHLNQWRWRFFPGGYAIRSAVKSDVGYKRDQVILMHRVVMGVPPNRNVIIDHLDHNGINNQKSNLRKCTQSQNCHNRTNRKNSQSQYLGVCYAVKSKLWIVSVTHEYKSIYIGCYHNEIEAALAYNEAAIKYHGEFANLNNVIIPDGFIKLGRRMDRGAKSKYTKYRGLSFDNRYKTWHVVVCVGKKRISCGNYKNEIEAALVYNKRAIELLGSKAKLNIIKDGREEG